ncbi:hypothetical protein [Actinocrispum wychmicini]|uniref:Uncharacterized protein n=1 Tax=Actinocrispum wychmicini TaxID=1213861 RepID=A0A4R2IRJ0_9PSEU|nr:hypothetical protein [Actinocrispum wychmicini]TCO48001.1 hypothetical protein EV192_11654 [Actinocrispum wychmicini]
MPDGVKRSWDKRNPDKIRAEDLAKLTTAERTRWELDRCYNGGPQPILDNYETTE